ncbi:MAG: hypothetical protein WBE28_09755 [bacterium]
MAPTIKLQIFVGIFFLLVYQAAEFSSGELAFTVKFRDELSPYRTMSAFVLPDEILKLEIIRGANKGTYLCNVESGTFVTTAPTKWQWRAPSDKGLYPITVISPTGTDTMLLNVFVMVPYKELDGEYLNSYRIGNYPATPLKQLPIYKPPRGFIEVTNDNQDTYVSPHFKLKQFLCKQAGDYPKYIVLRERLLLKLELILAKVNDEGYKCETFHVMSGYRTPYYNKLIKDVKYSRHVWGGAADIFIDENPADGMMDDLDKNGVIDYRDAKVLYDIVDNIYGKPWYERFIGGLGQYEKTANHGPFVHIDVRGFRARWGK